MLLLWDFYGVKVVDVVKQFQNQTINEISCQRVQSHNGNELHQARDELCQTQNEMYGIVSHVLFSFSIGVIYDILCVWIIWWKVSNSN